MSNEIVKKQTLNSNLVQATIRIRSDQKNRLESERRARGVTLADVLRDNLDLAFAIKQELSKVVEGEYDENDPRNAPRLMHTLLFRVEERILAALDSLSLRLEKQNSQSFDSPINSVEKFISMISNADKYPTEVWLGAFLEVVPRLSLVGDAQIEELKAKGALWILKNES